MTVYDQREDLHAIRKERYRNTDGTYNGVSFMAQITGLSEAEIAWTFNRLKGLMSEGMSKADAKLIVTAEARRKPWEKSQ